MTPDNILEFQEKMIVASVCKISLTDAILGKTVPTKSQQTKINQKIKLLKQGHPLDYLLGQITINGLSFKLNKNVLIPREETEDWTKLFSQKIHPFDLPQAKTLVDLGTGSGFIGLSLAKHYSQVVLTDISHKALKIAKTNAKTNNINNLLYFRSDLLANLKLQKILKHTTWGLIVNLPYLPVIDKIEHQNSNVHYEPELALYSGDDGLDLFRRLIIEMKSVDLPSFAIFELDPRNILEAENFVINNFSQTSLKTYIWQDLWGKNRVLICKFDNTI